MAKLNIAHLALHARNLLEKQGGFTLDEFGNEPDSNLTPWAVSIPGELYLFSGIPCLLIFCQYLADHSPFASGALFGGWLDESGVCHLEHTAVYAHKHTAIQEGIRGKQRFIFNLAKREELSLEGIPDLTSVNLVG